MSQPVKPNATSEEIHSISYLRGLAALGVVLYHVRIDLWVGLNAIKESPTTGVFAHLVAWLSLPTVFMSCGVILFFVISGFCIHYPYAGRNGKNLDLREYTIRRFFRIYPPYLIAVILTFGVQWIGYHEGFLKGLDSSNYQLSALMLQNTFGSQPECNPVFWTIPIEVAFYIFFPVVYWGLKKFCSSLLALVMVISLLAIGLSVTHSMRFSFLPYWVIWIAGATLAEKYKNGQLPQPPSLVSIAAFLFFLIGLFCNWKVRSAADSSSIGVYVELITLLGSLAYGLAFSVLLWWSVLNQWIYALIPPLLHRFLLHLGLISYSLYLFHTPLFRLCGWGWISIFGGKPVNYLITFPFVILAILIASLAFLCFEAPAHHVGRNLARQIKNRIAN